MAGENSVWKNINDDSYVHYLSWKTTGMNHEIFLYDLGKRWGKVKI